MTALSDRGISTIFENYIAWRNRFRMVNILAPTALGWTSSHAGSGVSGSAMINDRYVGTGVVANSRGLNFHQAGGLDLATCDRGTIDWSRKLYLVFYIERNVSDAEVVARLQFKMVNTEGALANRGLGIRLDNRALMGESYGGALGVVDLGVTVTLDTFYWIEIEHNPGVSDIWKVNGVQLGAQTTVNNIPDGARTFFIVGSIINGPTGGAACYFRWSDIIVITKV